MPDESKNQFHKIEDIKRKLYDRDFSKTSHRKEGILHAIPHEVAPSWEESGAEPIKPVRSSLFKKFFIAAVIFFLGALGFAFYKYQQGTSTVSSDNIQVTVLGNSFTEGGQELPLQVEIVNKNNSSLELADMMIEYPKGASLDPNADMVRLPREAIGTIPAGGQIERNEKVTLYGDQGTVRNVTVVLEYHPAGSNAIFTKQTVYPVTISSSPLSLIFDGPTQTASNQEVTFNITATLNTSLPSDATMLQVQYPSGFTFENATPAPALGNSFWSLKDLAVGKPLSITLKGILVGQDGDQQAFHTYVGTPSPDNQSISVVYNSLLNIVALQKPFLQANIIIAGQDLDQYPVTGGKSISAQVVWSNNLPTQITDAQITLAFSGNAYDKSTVSPGDGFFDSTNNQIVWNKSTNSDFASVQPGASGSLNFTFTPISIGGSNQSITSPQIVMQVSIQGTQPGDTGPSQVTNVAKKIAEVTSNFQLAAGAVFRSGPFPPQAEKDTTYTITWTLSNSSNSITGAQAQAILPLYVKWGNASSGTAENIAYNPSTRAVTWNIGTVRPYTGFGSVNREVSFNVILSPSTSQIGSIPQLIQDVLLTGTDSFTNSTISSHKGALNTRLDSDPNFKTGDETVVQ